MVRTSMLAAGGVEKTRSGVLIVTLGGPRCPERARGGVGGGSAGADVTTFDQYMLIGPGFRPQLVGTTVADGPGAMETIGIMCMELLHTDLYTGPATEIGATVMVQH